MKKLFAMTLMISVVLLASTAFADRGYGRSGSNGYASQGTRIERHLDRQGDQIQHRFEQKANWADRRGMHYKADRMRVQGERINRHLDRKGEWIHARLDQRYDQDHHMHYRTHRHEYHGQPVVYRNAYPYDSYFGLIINQPGLFFSWGLHR